jgi:SAM-dependent methyltransferase
VPPPNLDRLTRVYGPTTWAVYEQLDAGLAPAGPDRLHDLAGAHLPPCGAVLDVGCRDAKHLVRLVRDHDATGVGVEPVPLHVERARQVVAAAGLTDRIEIHQGGLEDLEPIDDRFDLVWCRDVLTQVADLDAVVGAMARAVRRDGHVVVLTTFATDLLHTDDRALLDRHLGNVPANLDRPVVEAAFARAGLRVDSVIEVGTEWHEHAVELGGASSLALLRLARLRRRRAEIVAQHGEEVSDHIEANLHWEVFLLLGRLAPVAHLLRRA